MAQIPFTSFTLQVLHAGIKSINVSVHACQCRHHNRHSESVQCTVTILFVSVTITYRHSESVQCSHHHVCVSITDRHSESVQCSHHHVCVSITDRHSESVQCSHHHVCQCQHHRQALRVSSVQSPSCLSVSASQTGTQSQFSAVTIMSVSVSITDRHSESVQCTVTTYLFCKVPQVLFPYIYKWPHYPQITFPEEKNKQISHGKNDEYDFKKEVFNNTGNHSQYRVVHTKAVTLSG